jgi:hypothetical protein
MPGKVQFARILFACIAVVALMHGLGRSDIGGVVAQRSVEWTRYEVHLDVRQDGRVHVSELQEIEFQGGAFSAGFATIPLARIDQISDVRVSELVQGQPQQYVQVASGAYVGEPGTFIVETSASDVYIDWGFSPALDETRTFRLEYFVDGAIRVYLDEDPPNQQIWWIGSTGK